MRNKLSIIIFTLFLMLSFGSVEQVLACSCYPSMPCQNYQNADVSFFGKVIEKKQTKNNTYQTTFEVYKEYKNRKSQKEIEIYSRNDEGICGYNFEVGKEYIVFANKTKSSSEIKGFWTGSCYGNIRTEYDDDKIFDYLKEVSSNGTSSMISGRIRKNTYRFEESLLMSEIKIKAQRVDDKNKIFTGIPDKDGIFRIKVPTGQYLIIAELPSGYVYGQRRRKNDGIFTVENQKCSAAFLSFANDSEIKGKLLNFKGNPIKNTEVELISANYTKDKPNDNYDDIKTDENGDFIFKYIPSGKYILGLNSTPFKNPQMPFPTVFYQQTDSFQSAQVIEIGQGEKIDNITFQIPFPIRNVKIKGVVLGLKNKPIKNANIFLRDAELNNWVDSVGTKTDEKGRFELEGFEGRSYKIYATATVKNNENPSKYTNAKQTTQAFTLDDNTEEFKIVLPLNIID